MKAACKRFTIGVATFLICMSAIAADESSETRTVIAQFEAALQKRDIEAVGRLVSPDIVVFENGYRNDGWADFRDHHLVPEFKAPPTPYITEIVKVEASPTMAWGYSKMSRSLPGRSDRRADVWSTYVLRKEAGQWKIVALNWSVRRSGAE